MQRLIVGLESAAKAKELQPVLQPLTFVSHVVAEESEEADRKVSVAA